MKDEKMPILLHLSSEIPNDDELKEMFTDDNLQALIHSREVDRYVCGLCNISISYIGRGVIYGNRILNLCAECFKKLNNRMAEMVKYRKGNGQLHPHVTTTEGIEALKELNK